MAAEPLLPAALQARQAMVEKTLTTDGPGVARGIRTECTATDVPAAVANRRAGGNMAAPDAADICIASLRRQAHDRALMSLYQDIVGENRIDQGMAGPHGRWELLHSLQDLLKAQAGYPNDAVVQDLPARIVTAASTGARQLDIGTGKPVAVTSGLTMDVGFAMAYWQGNAARSMAIPDASTLKTMTEQCVTQRGDLKRCLAVGYAQGKLAFQAAARTAAR
jgi:hypothetical protein